MPELSRQFISVRCFSALPFLSSRCRHRQSSDYILDITTIYERRNVPYLLYFRRVLWFASAKEKENVAYVTLMFDQV